MKKMPLHVAINIDVLLLKHVVKLAILNKILVVSDVL